MHFFTDAQLAIGLAIAAVHLVGSAFIVWKSITNGRGIEGNHAAIVGVDNKATLIAADVVLIRAASARIQATLDGPKYGRRATDIAPRPGGPEMRSAKPTVAGLSPADGTTWPIGGDS